MLFSRRVNSALPVRTGPTTEYEDREASGKVNRIQEAGAGGLSGDGTYAYSAAAGSPVLWNQSEPL